MKFGFFFVNFDFGHLFSERVLIALFSGEQLIFVYYYLTGTSQSRSYSYFVLKSWVKD